MMLGFDVEQSKKAVARFGKDSVQRVVSKDPYIMCHVSSNFDEVDQVCRIHFAMNPYDPRRLDALMGSSIKSLRETSRNSCNTAEYMHICFQNIQIRYKNRELDSMIRKHVESRASSVSRHFVLDAEIDPGKKVVYEPSLYEAEVNLANHLASFVGMRSSVLPHFRKEPEVDEDDVHFLKLDARQRRAVQNALSERVSLLSGIAGAGKSYTVAIMAKRMMAHAGSTVLIVSPTGKAVQRIRELLDQNGIDEKRVSLSTVHSFVYSFETRSGVSMECHIDDPDTKKRFPCDFVIVDEASMLSLEMAERLLKAVGTFAKHATFVGDPEQLPSIDAGSVFLDLIACNLFPHIHLDKAHRALGGILQNSRAILAGKAMEFDGESTVHVEATTKDYAAAVLLHMQDEAEPPAVVCRLVEVADKMNKAMQERYNPRALGKKELQIKLDIVFRVGDVVMNGKNYDIATMNFHTPTRIRSTLPHVPLSGTNSIANGQ